MVPLSRHSDFARSASDSSACGWLCSRSTAGCSRCWVSRRRSSPGWRTSVVSTSDNSSPSAPSRGRWWSSTRCAARPASRLTGDAGGAHLPGRDLPDCRSGWTHRFRAVVRPGSARRGPHYRYSRGCGCRLGGRDQRTARRPRCGTSTLGDWQCRVSNGRSRFCHRRGEDSPQQRAGLARRVRRRETTHSGEPGPRRCGRWVVGAGVGGTVGDAAQFGRRTRRRRPGRSLTPHHPGE